MLVLGVTFRGSDAAQAAPGAEAEADIRVIRVRKRMDLRFQEVTTGARQMEVATARRGYRDALLVPVSGAQAESYSVSSSQDGMLGHDSLKRFR